MDMQIEEHAGETKGSTTQSKQTEFYSGYGTNLVPQSEWLFRIANVASGISFLTSALILQSKTFSLTGSFFGVLSFVTFLVTFLYAFIMGFVVFVIMYNNNLIGSRYLRIRKLSIIAYPLMLIAIPASIPLFDMISRHIPFRYVDDLMLVQILFPVIGWVFNLIVSILLIRSGSRPFRSRD
jgi:hypothetical protein